MIVNSNRKPTHGDGSSAIKETRHKGGFLPSQYLSDILLHSYGSLQLFNSLGVHAVCAAGRVNLDLTGSDLLLKLINLIVDLLYRFLDPRIRLEGK